MMKEALDIEAIRRELGPVTDKIMDGKRVAKLVRQEVRKQVDFLKEKGLNPTLAVVLVGDDPASKTYVKSKVRACKDVGLNSIKQVLPKETTQEELEEHLLQLNKDPNIDGILLQLPLPSHLDKTAATHMISPWKDVDGFHPLNLGGLLARQTRLEACTPRGVMILLAAYDVELQGKRACVIGRSVMVGRPMAQMLIRANATVTVCHRYTENLPEIVSQSDIVVAAAGVPELVKGAWIKPEAVVVDVGINHVDGKMVGDVEFHEAIKRARLISPVPGGIGPMTVASLMANSALAAWRHYNKDHHVKSPIWD